MIREMFSQTGAASRVLATHGEDIQIRENSCFFCAAHEAKEIVIALALARYTSLEVPIEAPTKEQFERVVARCFLDYEKSAISESDFPGRGNPRDPR